MNRLPAWLVVALAAAACTSAPTAGSPGGAGGGAGSGGSGGVAGSSGAGGGSTSGCEGLTCSVPTGESCVDGRCVCNDTSCPQGMICNAQYLCQELSGCPPCSQGETCLPLPAGGANACQCNPGEDRCPEGLRCSARRQCEDPCEGGCNKGESCKQIDKDHFACQCNPSLQTYLAGNVCNTSTLRCEKTCVPDCLAGETCVDGKGGKVCRCDPAGASCGTGLACDSTAQRCLPADLEQATHDLAAAFCKRSFECMPYFPLSRAWGDDEAACTQRQFGYFKRALSAPGSPSDDSFVGQCTQAALAASCQDFDDFWIAGAASGALPSCSVPPAGRVPSGLPCAYRFQCSSGFCAATEGSCGTCAAQGSAIGDACDDGHPCDATQGLACHPTSSKCFRPAHRLDNCRFDTDCLSNLVCRNEQCADPTSTEGASCDPTANNCDFVGAALNCNQAGTCEPPLTAKVNESCGSGDGGNVVACQKGSLCDGSVDGWNGICVAGQAGVPGQPCAYKPCEGCPWTQWAIDGPPCAYEATCVAGTCHVDDPETCK